MINDYEKRYSEICGHTSGTETEIICPYCGYEERDSWESQLDHEETDDSHECPECGEVFSVTATITRTFQSEKKVAK